MTTAYEEYRQMTEELQSLQSQLAERDERIKVLEESLRIAKDIIKSSRYDALWAIDAELQPHSDEQEKAE